MGQLFAQMATLVSEQSEVIQRIEDDVESGLVDTLEAQGHIQQVYDITKGNRSMILKIFALLVVFIFLFLVWT
jgi:t-SNARE complex subunit (syntaxin)